VFLTHPKGVLFWHSKAEQHASDQSDHPESEGLTPVVLRVPKNDVRKPKEDEIGTKDAGYVPAVKTSKKVAATNLEVFHKGKWKPVEHHWRINPLRSYRKEPGEEGEKDLYYPKEHHENPLHPQPEHLGLKYW
jgi:hypothetical protein